MRILVANTPLMYRESLAMAIHRHNPDFEVMMADPASIDGEAERFGPHVLVRDDRQAPPLQRLREAGRQHEGRGGEEGALGRLDLRLGRLQGRVEPRRTSSAGRRAEGACIIRTIYSLKAGKSTCTGVH